MRAVLAVMAAVGVLGGCTSTEPAAPAPVVSTPPPASVRSEQVTDFVLPAGVEELTPVVKQDSPDVYRFAFKGVKPGTLYVWISCTGEGRTPVVVGKVATFDIQCGAPGLSGSMIEVPEGLPAFDVAVMKGLNVQKVQLLVGSGSA